MAGLPWIKVEVVLPDHPKLEAFESAAGLEDGLGFVVRLWTYAARYYPGGRIPDKGIESAIFYASRGGGVTGNGADLVGALVSAGWLDRGPGYYAIHDWEEFHEAHAKKAEQNRERQRRFRDRRKGAAKDNALRAETVTLPVTPLEERRGEEREITAADPPAAAALEVPKGCEAPRGVEALEHVEPAPWEAFREALEDRLALPRGWLRVARPEAVEATRATIDREVARLGLPRAVAVAYEAAIKVSPRPRWLAYFLGPLTDAGAGPRFREAWEGESPKGPEAWPVPTAAQLEEWEAEARRELEAKRGSA